MTQAWFIPGRPRAPEGPLARYRPIQPVWAVGAYVRALTQPDDLVVDLFCQGPIVVRETASAGRRALGLSINPLLLVAARLGLGRRDADALNAAFTKLADSPKGDVPLRQHLASLYRSTCPACGEAGVAEWFAWDRDGNYPFKKAVRCPECKGPQEGTPDDKDLDLTRRTQPRGLAYYYALDRAAPPGHPARDRAAELVELYTPRNLSALMDISMRLEGLEADEEVKDALTGVLLDCFDASSSLDPYGEERARPRTLRAPSRYLERNVWLCFEDGFSHLLAEEPPPAVPQAADDVAALAKGEAEGFALASYAARDVRQVVEPDSVALVVSDPPRPDGVFWALSALWAGWLWETPAARRLRPFLRRRRFDWDWHWRVLRAALKASGPLLAAEGLLVTPFYEPDGTLLESVCLAASSAAWGYCPEAGYRLVWRWENAKPSPAADVEELESDLMAAAEEALVSTLRERGEPTEGSLLHASACARLTERGLLARAAAIPENKETPSPLSLATAALRRALESAPIMQLTDREETEETLWWLKDSTHAAEPLADRVEAQVWELLVQQPAWSHEVLVNAVYACFPGPLTPDLSLVLVCIDSYSVQEGETLRLRPEDDPLRRAGERRTLRDDLVELGKRLGFKVRKNDDWDVRWLEEKQEAYVFAISATTALAAHLLIKREAGERTQRCLILPGGRAQLVAFKLQRDPRLARAVEVGEWQFIKFRHLRRLIAEEELDRHALKTVLGLDPIAEQEAAQIPLF
jgi:hypothetical protein